ncbi:uncharacterized protein [Epargyreus clarus]|uniref:uncharacterized protein n=1 Tax=Epargyreus clarus TaxID=520877 RepID=UPI003C2C8558
MWSTALDAILTTLRYLAPATLLTLFWGQQSFLFKLLKHIDSAFRAIVFSSDEQKQAVLQWLAEVGPVRVEHLDTVWRHGWILCGVLDGALPGACAGHPPTRLSLKHAQAIADHYLGVEPVFTRQELESSDALSRHQEWKLATYLDRIRLALSKLTPAVSRPVSQRTSPDNKLESQVTLDYVAKGSGLTAAQVNNKVYFKIYPTAQQSLDPGEVTILIRGPKDAYGMAILPPILGKAQLIRHKLLGLQSKASFTENALPITQGATYLRNYGKNDMNKTYFIPKTKYDIEIDVETRKDHARVGYIVNCIGKYEISITSRGQSIVGSPFKVTVSNNIVRTLEKESFCLEDGEEIDIVDVKTDRKVVLRIVDFVTEKMLLRENGCLEKITNEEAKFLMETDSDISNFKSTLSVDNKQETGENKQKTRPRFQYAAQKVIKMNRVCHIFNDLKGKEALLSDKKATCVLQKSQQDIPDIVNSTFSDNNMHTYMMPEKQGRVIIPESISVSIMTEKSKLYQEDNQSLNDSETNTDIIFNSPDYLEKYKIMRDPFEDDELSSVDTAQSSNNPFITDMYTENYTTEKKLGAFLATEYETNNSQNEEIQNNLQIPNLAAPNNPFVYIDMANLERPKSPVFKLVDELPNREDISEEMLGNEFINPFFTHHHPSNQYTETETVPVTDFIIGAPVSLPPIVRATSPEPHLDSSVLSADSGILDIQKNKKQDLNTEPGNLCASSSTDAKLQSEISSSGHSSFHTTSSSNDSYQSKVVSNIPLPSVSPKKDMWDSAYVSIDDNNSSPDSNNNDNSLPEPISKPLFPPSDELSSMGPAEREIWETCSELKEEHINTYKMHEEPKIHKWDSKRPTFTPIIEENDRSLYTDMKDSINETDTDPVTTAFSELNEMFDDYFPQSENGSTTTECSKLQQNVESEYTIERNDVCVDSASEERSDVKRQVQELEGMISEVQASVTESDSASRILHVENNDNKNHHIPVNKDKTQFGDHKQSNIVLERKKYWDEKIRQIQAKTDEMKAQQKKRRVYSKPLKHNDSLSKKKGKQMIKNFLNASEEYQKYSKPVNMKQTDETITRQSPTEEQVPDEKLVEKWKNFWDSKLEIEKETEIAIWRPKSSPNKETPKSVGNSPSSLEDKAFSTEEIDSPNTQDFDFPNKQDFDSPIKQELPEEVFRAFETSPKRFFGTSRKQILSKIDTFLGKPNIDESSSSKICEISRETGLVSSRISLFHTISQTEELPWVKRKCQSLHNLHPQKDNEKPVVQENTYNTNKEDETHNVSETVTSKTEHTDIVSKVDSSYQDVVLSDDNISEINTDAKHSSEETKTDEEKHKICVKMAIKEFNEYSQPDYNFNSTNKLKTSISKSEMDIFSKVSNKSSDENLDKHKSYEELPKINVKRFISLYEGTSKSSLESKSPQGYKKSKIDSSKPLQVASSDQGTEKAVSKPKRKFLPEQLSTSTSGSETNSSSISLKTAISRHISSESTSDSIDVDVISNQDQDSPYLSLSDIDLEIIDSPETSPESSPEKKVVTENVEYKNRFQIAKQYFQSLEELREEKKYRKLNECEMLLYGAANESPTNNNATRQTGRIKKKLKANSLPSSEIAKAWSQLQDNQDSDSNAKMVKISEKFNVDDLFNDVMEGRLSRQGSLRGIPHKKAVLEAFKSMENITDKKLSPYEMAVSQLSDFAKENQIRNAQTYLSEYPYLPTTDPSKYHSRLDTNASGLISFKELLEKKPRRNSVPDLRLNPAFTVDL